MSQPLITHVWPVTTRHLLLLLCLPVLFLGTGCRMVQTAVEVPGRTVRAVAPGERDRNAVDPVEVQQRLLRFADEYSTQMVFGFDKLRRGTNALEPAELLKWKITLETETCSIASGPNAIGNLLDMTVFVTVTRMALEVYWQPKVFGESAQPMLTSCRNAETNIWQLTSRVLTPEQQAELRQAIDAWFQQNPLPENVVGARAVGFASQVAEANPAGKARAGSVFSLLMLDPLSSLDPATREIAQTRLLAERALYVTQKIPLLLRWHTELVTITAVQLPAMQQLVSNSTQVAASAERFAGVMEKLPGQVSTEREEILKALESQEKDLAALVNEVRQALNAGSQMSASLNTTLTTFDALMKRFGVGETNNANPPTTNTEPFRIQDYGRTAAQLEATGRQLTELLHTLDHTLDSTNLARLSAQVGPAVQQAQAGGKALVDYAFWKGILLVTVVLLAALVYHFLVARLTPATPARTHSP